MRSLQEWEEKQKVHADAIEEQKKKDEERIRAKEREAAEKRREAGNVLKDRTQRQQKRGRKSSGRRGCKKRR